MSEQPSQRLLEIIERAASGVAGVTAAEVMAALNENGAIPDLEATAEPGELVKEFALALAACKRFKPPTLADIKRMAAQHYSKWTLSEAEVAAMAARCREVLRFTK